MRAAVLAHRRSTAPFRESLVLLRFLGWLVLLACVGLVVAVCALPFAVVDEQPLVEAGARLKPPQTTPVKRFLPSARLGQVSWSCQLMIWAG